MPRFFLDHIPGDTVRLEGEDARHIARALRMRPGEELTLCDLQGHDYRCAIESADQTEVLVRVLEKTPCQSEVPCRLRLFQALPKGDKLELIIQKATELGVHEIVPVITERCISRPHTKSMDKKRERLQKIALEAAKQSGRGAVPQVLPMLTLDQAIPQMTESDLAILFYEEGTIPLREVLRGDPPASIALLVGSEGGFNAREVSLARDAGVRVASLGSRILRCETAPLCALSAILYHLGEF